MCTGTEYAVDALSGELKVLEDCSTLPSKFLVVLAVPTGLPAALPALPLELTVLYNSLLFTVGASDSVIKGEAEGIRQGLLRVLEACGACGEDLGTEELWEKVLQEVTVEELQAPLHRLGALQAAWWLAASRLGSVAGLFQLLSTAEDLGRAHCSEGQNKLLSIIKAWQVPPEEASLPLVQSAKDLKEILCTAAAFLQGLWGGRAFLPEDRAGALAHRAGAKIVKGGTSTSSREVADASPYGTGKKRAPPLVWDLVGHKSELQNQYAVSVLGLQELEAGNFPAALSLLQEAAGGFCSKNILAQIYTCLGCCAQRMGKPQTALQHLKQALQVDFQCLPALSHVAAVYHKLGETGVELQALTLLYEVCLVPLDGSSALPRIPEVFLEAASALEQAGRHQDAITVCEEVISRTTDLIPRVLRVEERLEQRESSLPGAELVGGFLSQKKESMCCLAWRAAGYLQQGWAWAKLGESKEAVTQFSSSSSLAERLNFAICFQSWRMSSPSVCVCVPVAENLQPEVEVLQKIRLLSLIGRGTQFLELGKNKKALLDFQHSLQISPGDPAAASYLVQTLWKMNRKQEAAAQWLKLSQSSPGDNGQQPGQGRCVEGWSSLLPCSLSDPSPCTWFPVWSRQCSLTVNLLPEAYRISSEQQPRTPQADLVMPTIPTC
ncbi:Fanconi anemia group G [Lonchura striata]|uniref:Fanconi anemia group G n=1 Tax=Lonchura striata TaxID=40157 RepID=A0A218UZG5_9PASE|nr:Fanconi anemia group G [Lonchura striata domestica]